MLASCVGLFLLLGEIENHLRDMLNGQFSRKDLEDARDPLDSGRPITDVSESASSEEKS